MLPAEGPRAPKRKLPSFPLGASGPAALSFSAMLLAPPTLRELFSKIPDACVVALSAREEDLNQFANAAQDSTAEDADLVEDGPFGPIPVALRPESGFTHFLDGAQRSWRVGYVGLAPIYLAHTSAGLLRRVDREVLPPEKCHYSGELELVVPEYASLDAFPTVGRLTVGVAPEETEMSMKQRIANAVSARRDERETEVARGFRDGCLLVDGGIGQILERMPEGITVAGIVKSHQRQYFASKERVRVILDLKAGERTAVFLRERNHPQGREAYSFYLKLHSSDEQGPLYGLVRVEVPATTAMLAMVEEISAWLLAERAPLSLPDARYDKMLYPIRLVERHLKARQPSEAAIRAIQGI